MRGELSIAEPRCSFTSTLESEHRAEDPNDEGLLASDLPPGEPERPPSCSHGELIADSVPLKRSELSVVRAPVDLDDHTVVWIPDIDAMTARSGIVPGSRQLSHPARQVVALAQPTKPRLQLRLGRGVTAKAFVEHTGHRSRPRSPGPSQIAEHQLDLPEAELPPDDLIVDVATQ